MERAIGLNYPSEPDLRQRIFLKLLAVFVLAIVIATVALDLSLRRVWKETLDGQMDRELRQKTAMFADRINAASPADFERITAAEAAASGARATVVDASGRALADSDPREPAGADESQQPEIMGALEHRVGSPQRRNDPQGNVFLYTALTVDVGAVRLAYPLEDIGEAVARMQSTLLLAAVIALGVAVFVAALVAQSISRRLQAIVEFAERIAGGDLSARIVPISGDEIGRVASTLDKTAREFEGNFEALKNSQRQLETLLNSMQDAVIAIGPDERVQWANQTMDRLVSGRTRIQAPIIETVRDPDFLRTLRAARDTRAPASARATTMVQGRAFDVTAAPMPAGGTVVVLRDLTETERAEKTRRDFIANVSHELRTPLTSIQGYTETLLDASTEPNPSREFLEIIRKNAMRMSRLTEDLLTLARVESGEQRFEIRPILPEEILREANQSFAEIARSQGVKLEVENSVTEPVNADLEAIHQVLSNLIENALKYASATDRILLGACHSSDGVEFYVRDFGPGISSEHLSRLFERFYRVDKARSRESGGTGLGLAIAKHIVLAHNGAIRAESELNHGSTFLFTLPMARAAEPIGPIGSR